LSNADLISADLRNADLTCANLRDANLTNADLTNANLRGANLYSVNLTNANLMGARLRGANMRNANLLNTNVMVFQGSSHVAYATPAAISIGCEYHLISYWLENYAEIGKKAGYSEKEIATYYSFIRLAAETFAEATA